MSDARRQSTRVETKFDATITLTVPVNTKNLSMRGMLCSPEPRDKGLLCRATIRLGLGTAIQVEGSIVRMDEHGVAMRFSSMDPDSFNNLRRAVQLNADNAEAIDEELLRGLFGDEDSAP